MRIIKTIGWLVLLVLIAFMFLLNLLMEGNIWMDIAFILRKLVDGLAYIRPLVVSIGLGIMAGMCIDDIWRIWKND